MTVSSSLVSLHRDKKKQNLKKNEIFFLSARNLRYIDDNLTVSSLVSLACLEPQTSNKKKTKTKFKKKNETMKSLRGRPALSFEDWNVNDEYVSRNQTISNTDVVRFVQMTGYAGESLFNDKTYYNRVGHSRRLVPAALTLSVADGLIIGSGAFENYAIALLKIDGCVAKRPVYADDTIRVHIKVLSKRKSKSKPDRGIVTTHQTVLNQNNQVVMEYEVTRMLRCRIVSSNL